MNKPDLADANRLFPGVPTCSRYAAIGPIEEARQRVCRMLDRGEALGVVMGPPGTGKTLLCQKIASLYRHSHAIVNLGDIRVSSRQGLIQQVLFHLGKPHQGADESSLHLALVQSLTQTVDTRQSLLLIIDEAQMFSAELLDEVRMMTNLVRQGRPMVQTLLVGGPRLDDTLADPQLESLTQRIAVRCYLHPLTQAETDQYIRTAMSVIALRIDDQAIASVHHASGGIPRLINQLMDQAIDVAREQQKSCLDDSCVQLAWADLQQLPSPVLDADLRPQGTAIEFGELDSSSTDCLSQVTEDPEIGAAAIETTTDAEPATAAADQRAELTPEADELFGVDFDQETPLDLVSPQGPQPTLDPADTELALHEEICILSQAAKSAMADRTLQGQRAEVISQSGPAEPTEPVARPDNSIEQPPQNDSCDVPDELAAQLAVVWSDEEVVAPQADDRDLLVIEDEVTVIDEDRPTSFVASGALRKPPQDIDQNFQNLFSRLRSGQ